MRDLAALIAFVSARLDEHEAAAREACDGDSGKWFMGDRWNVYRAEDDARYDEDYQGEENRLVVYGNVKPQSEHIALHDPFRVLREVEAGRDLLAAYEEIRQLNDEESPSERAMRMAMAEVVRMLVISRARVWSDHPDYRDEWKP